MEGCFTFQWGGGCFSDVGLHFYVGIHPMGGNAFDGGVSKKIVGWGWATPPMPPTMGNPV